MTPEERPECDRQIGVLCAAYNVPATADRLEAYWRGLVRMTLARLSRAVETAIGETGPDKIPTTKQLWRIGWGKTSTSNLDTEKSAREMETADGATRKRINAEMADDPLGARIRLIDALNARCDVLLDPSSEPHANRKEWLREQLAEATRLFEAAGRGEDYELWRLTLHLTGRDRRPRGA